MLQWAWRCRYLLAPGAARPPPTVSSAWAATRRPLRTELPAPLMVSLSTALHVFTEGRPPPDENCWPQNTDPRLIETRTYLLPVDTQDLSQGRHTRDWVASWAGCFLFFFHRTPVLLMRMIIKTTTINQAWVFVRCFLENEKSETATSRKTTDSICFQW